ncbi:hypothetical protein FORC64_2521 [Escherichia coli]|nr:hypothetical protein FORC64_2521 [Escherichia coli]QBP85727.1 hypothetical protein FORC81_0964 [Escherichia coli]
MAAKIRRFMAQAEVATANYLMQRLYTDWV